MGFSSVRLVLLLLCCLELCIWSVQGLNLYKMYPYDEQQALENAQENNYFGNEDDAQIVKRKPNNYKFFLKGLRGKRSAPYQQLQMEQFQNYPSTFQN